MFNQLAKFEKSAALLLTCAALGGCAVGGDNSGGGGLQPPLKPAGGQYETAYRDVKGAPMSIEGLNAPNETVAQQVANISDLKIRALAYSAIEYAYASDASINADSGSASGARDDLKNVTVPKLRVRAESVVNYGLADFAGSDISFGNYGDARSLIADISSPSLKRQMNTALAEQEAGNSNGSDNITTDVYVAFINKYGALDGQAEAQKGEIFRHTEEYLQQYKAAESKNSN